MHSYISKTRIKGEHVPPNAAPMIELSARFLFAVHYMGSSHTRWEEGPYRPA